jgi:hypothetical protein
MIWQPDRTGISHRFILVNNQRFSKVIPGVDGVGKLDASEVVRPGEPSSDNFISKAIRMGGIRRTTVDLPSIVMHGTTWRAMSHLRIGLK